MNWTWTGGRREDRHVNVTNPKAAGVVASVEGPDGRSARVWGEERTAI